MKAYLIVTAVLFGALVVVHIWRVVVQGPRLLTDIWWILITLVAAVICLWACRLLWLARPSNKP